MFSTASMVNFTLERDWGALDLYVLPSFRERTYPASEGRLRGLAPVLDDAAYESDAGRWHTDFAVRWSHAMGDMDLGVAGFYGTSREPYLLPIDAEHGLASTPSTASRCSRTTRSSISSAWTLSTRVAPPCGSSRR